MSRPLTIAVAVLVLLGSLTVVGFINDPFGWRKHQVAALQTKTATATDNAAARTIEAQGERKSAQRVDLTIHQQKATAAHLAKAIQLARSAPDANQDLPADRVARLRAHDDLLCANTRLRGCAAAPAADAGQGH